jgi:integrase
MKRREEGSIEERVQGKKYLIRWTVKDETGKAVRKNKIVRGDFIEAQAELARMVRPTNDEAPKPERTFASYADREWAQYTQDKWKDSTQTTQGSFVTRHIRPYFDSMVLSQIKPDHVSAWHQWLTAKGLSRKTRRTIHSILGTMFTHAAEMLELIPKSPVKKGLAPKVGKREKPTLTPEQAWSLWDKLADAAIIRHRAFYGVLLFTGIRTGEALGLHWEDVDFASRQLTVRRAIFRGKETTPKTETSLRTRPMPPELYTALLNHKAMAHYTQPTDYVFASSSGRPANPDALRETLQSVLRDKLKIVLGPREDGLHLLRHTSGSLVFAKTGNVKETQAWLGHSSSRITLDTYTHLMEQSQKTTADQVFARPEVPAPPRAPELQN